MDPRASGMNNTRPGIVHRYGAMLFLGAALVLPTLNPGLAWIMFLVPMAVFIVLAENEKNRNCIGMIILVALIAATVKGEITSACFGLAMIPAGVTIKVGLEKKYSPTSTATRMFIVMAVSWFIMGIGIAMLSGRNVYGLLLGNLQEAMKASLDLFQNTKDLDPGQLQEIRTTAAAIKKILPQVLPGVIFASLVGSTMLNLVLGQWLLQKRRPELVIWPPFSSWKAPEPLVFAVILAGFGLLMPLSGLRPVAIGVLLSLNVIYFYQGLAILTRLFEYWHTPVGLRAIVYGLMVLQAYGIIFLSFTGIIDVWADFRGKLERMDRDKNSSDIKENPEE